MEIENSNNKIIASKFNKEQLAGSGMALALILIFVGIKTGMFINFKIAIIALLVNMTIPKVFYPIAVFWYTLSNLLGHIMPKVMLSILYFVLVLPMGIARKLSGKDPLMLNLWKKGTTSVMKSRNHTYSSNDLEKPY